MNKKITTTAVMMALVTLACAQDQSKSIREILENKYPTARERGLDSLQKVHQNTTSFIGQLERKKPMQGKSASSWTSRLDSIVSDFFYKGSFAYDENGNSTMEELSFYQFPDGWNIEQRVETVYNAENMPVERIISYWDFDLMQLEQEVKETFSYQEDGLVSETINYEWVTEEWVISIKIENTYDDQENITESVHFQWDESNQIFVAMMQQVHEYNSSGGLLEMVVSFWDQNEWVGSYKEVYVLNADDKPLSMETFQWVSADEIWGPYTLIEHTYDANGLEIELVQSYWWDGVYIPEGKLGLEYDDQDRIIAEEFFFWENEQWLGFFLDTYAYDAADNIVELTWHMWDSALAEYVPEGKQIATFDTETPSSDIMAPEWYEEFYNNKMLSAALFYFEDDQWIEDETSNFYYSPLAPTSVDDAADYAFMVYPNPFRETIRFSGSQEVMQFTLFDLQGRVVLQKQLAGASEINTGDLPAGMYVYQIDDINTRQAGKLVRE